MRCCATHEIKIAILYVCVCVHNMHEIITNHYASN